MKESEQAFGNGVVGWFRQVVRAWSVGGGGGGGHYKVFLVSDPNTHHSVQGLTLVLDLVPLCSAMKEKGQGRVCQACVAERPFGLLVWGSRCASYTKKVQSTHDTTMYCVLANSPSGLPQDARSRWGITFLPTGLQRKLLQMVGGRIRLNACPFRYTTSAGCDPCTLLVLIQNARDEPRNAKTPSNWKTIRPPPPSLALCQPPPPPPPSKSHIGELAPMALCDIHVAGCGEHLPAWGLRDDRIPGTDQAVRGGRHGQKLHSGFPPRQVDARGSTDAQQRECHTRPRVLAHQCVTCW